MPIRAVCFSIVQRRARPHKPAGESDLDLADHCRQRKTESTAFSESLRGGRAHLLGRKLGPVHTPEHPLIKPQSRAKIFLPLLGAFLTQIPKLDSKKFYKRVPPKLFSIYSCGVFLIYSCG